MTQQKQTHPLPSLIHRSSTQAFLSGFFWYKSLINGFRSKPTTHVTGTAATMQQLSMATRPSRLTMQPRRAASALRLQPLGVPRRAAVVRRYRESGAPCALGPRSTVSWQLIHLAVLAGGLGGLLSTPNRLPDIMRSHGSSAPVFSFRASPHLAPSARSLQRL